MKRRPLRAVLSAVLALILCLCTAAPALALSFPDVPEDLWCRDYIERLSNKGVINGYPGGGFGPDDTLRAGEFVKLTAAACGYMPLGAVICHWSQPYWNALEANGALVNASLPCAPEPLDAEISRYEMAALVSGALLSLGEEPVYVLEPETVVTDWPDVPEDFRDDVIQVYAKGIITGYADGSFGGANTLKRGEATAVIIRLMYADERRPADFKLTEPDPVEPPGPEDPEDPIDPGLPDPDYIPFALYIREHELVNGYGKATPELNALLFGDSSKTHFSRADYDSGYTKDYMEEVVIPVWRLNSKGERYADTTKVIVHKLVAYDVLCIFTQIFNDPEKFPIQSIGGARYTDTMRHAWGCAIDINWQENAYGYYKNGSFVATTGNGWYPGTNPYSITPGGSVVKAFADYGWGWGGQGYNSGYYDYMHFSIMESGG